MKRGLFVLALIMLFVLAGMAYSTDLVRVKIMPANLKPATGDEVMPNVIYHPTSPGTITQSPGDTAGYTQYDYQSNGSSGTRVVADNQGDVHVAWMNGDPYPGTRHVYFNCKTPSGWIAPGTGYQVDYRTGAGYTQLTTTLDDRSVVLYHRAATGQETTYVATDAFTCLNSFEWSRPPNRNGGIPFIWPYGVVDSSGRIHVVMTWPAPSGTIPEPFIYTRSNDGGTTWVANQRVDTLTTVSAMVTASRVSDKVAIVYTHPRDLTAQIYNDIYYIMSNDGVTWDFRAGKVNVTHYGQGGDSLWAYTDCDAVFDYNDNLHIVWNAQYSSSAGLWYQDSRLMHYERDGGTFSQIDIYTEDHWIAGCDMGVWNFMYAKMSIAPDADNRLFVTYTGWDSLDCSACGKANGDIYMNYSLDGGATWSPKENMTNSHTPGCQAGDCDSDHWSSLAETVTGNTLHLFYVNDKDAGGIPQTECTATDNPMLYLAYPVTAIHAGDDLPKDFKLSQNYPNPFNARTNIGFELLKNSHVNVTVYDITGSRVATLLDGDLKAGAHQISWDADRVASGLYYYTLKTSYGELTKKMTLLK